MHTSQLRVATTLPAFVDPTVARQDIVSWIDQHRPRVLADKRHCDFTVDVSVAGRVALIRPDTSRFS